MSLYNNIRTDVFIHDSAHVSSEAKIGERTKIWINSQIREKVSIGSNCIIGKDTYVDVGVQIGNGCKIQNGVSIYDGVTIGDEVFIGPCASFTNDKIPRAFNSDWKITPTEVKQGASIGANATITCGVVLGEYCMVAAGSVVTRDVPPYTLVMGTPAVQICEIDKMGNRVPGQANFFSGNTLYKSRIEPNGTMLSGNALRVGLAGLGQRGQNHIRVLSLIRNVELAFVYDPDPETARRSAEKTGAKMLCDGDALEENLQNIDALIIASTDPTGIWLLKLAVKKQKHIFMEKPIAKDRETLKQVAEVLENYPAVFQTGLLERFNPAIMELRKVLQGANRLITLDFSRTNSLRDSGLDREIDVIFDLMLHDIDLALHFGGKIRSVDAWGYFEDDRPQYVRATLHHENGCFSHLISSIVTPKRIRHVDITCDNMLVNCNLLRNEIMLNKPVKQSYLDYCSVSSVEEKLEVSPQETLLSQMLAFVQSCLAAGSPPSFIPRLEAAVESVLVACAIKDKVYSQLHPIEQATEGEGSICDRR